MREKYRAVIVGGAHMHALYMARDCIDNPNIELAGIADTPPIVDEVGVSAPFTRSWNLDYISKRLGVKLYPDWKRMLDEVKPAFCLVTTETPLHALVFEACAERGIICSVEKPMAVSLKEGLKLKRIAERTGGELLVNWPLAWQPFMGQFRELVRSGEVGRLIKLHQLVGHPGPLGRGVRHPRVDETSDKTTGLEKAKTWWHTASAGGGAMLDFCCYGAMACNWLMDGARATDVMGMCGNLESIWGDADDNAAMIVRYPSAICVLEGSWTTPVNGILPGPELYCTDAKLWCEQAGEDVVVKKLDYYQHITELPVIKPAPHMINVTTALVHHLDTGEPLPDFLNIDVNIDVLAILDAGVRSARSGKLEPVNNINWEIG